MATSRNRFRNELLAKLQETRSLALHWYLHDYCVGAKAKPPGALFNFAVLQRTVRLELETDAGNPLGPHYQALRRQRETLETAFGGPFTWDYNPKRASYQRISVTYPSIGYADDSNWATGMDKVIAVMVRFVKVLTPALDRLA